MQAADDAQVVGMLSDVRQEIADLQARLAAGRNGWIGPSSGLRATSRRVITMPKLSGSVAAELGQRTSPVRASGPAGRHDWARRA
jgi:hypothetical protein